MQRQMFYIFFPVRRIYTNFKMVYKMIYKDDFINERKLSDGTEAQKKLRDTLKKMLKHRPIREISVQELCKKACVGRTTFYSYYQNLDELLEEIEDIFVYDMFKLNNEMLFPEYKSPADFIFFSKSYEYIKDNKDLILGLIVNYPSDRFLEKWKNCIKYHFARKFGRQNMCEKDDYIYEMIAIMIIHSHIYYLKNNNSEVPQNDIVEMMSAVFTMFSM